MTSKSSFLLSCSMLMAGIRATGGGAVLEEAPASDGPWSAATQAVVGEPAPLHWQATVPLVAGVGQRFFRLVVDEPVAGVGAVRMAAGLAAALEIDFEGVVFPPGMVVIPAGAFAMGDCLDDSDDSGGKDDDGERPVHTIYLSAFLMDRFEVTTALWDEVATWGRDHGYVLEPAQVVKGPEHPVQSVSWCDAVRWCNARSERDGLTPVYRLPGGEVLRAGCPDLRETDVLWGSYGYRLPTEAEWEKGARGGLAGARFPWGDTITHSDANYYSSAVQEYDLSPTIMYHPDYEVPPAPYTAPVGSFASNGYGVCDVAGNLGEWCWDLHQTHWYKSPDATRADTRGPASGDPTGETRVIRGGAWGHDAFGLRCSDRNYAGPADFSIGCGFRCVRSLP